MLVQHLAIKIYLLWIGGSHESGTQ